MSKTITVDQLRQRLQAGEDIQMIDVRSAGEFAAGHVPKAIHIPLEQVETRLDDLETHTIALLCQSGRRAGMACDLLTPHGHDVLIVEGGTSAWSERGFGLVSSVSNRWSLERQVRLIAGLMVVIGVVLSLTASSGWVYLALFVGVGLAFAGATDICGMGLLLAKMPWNKSKPARSCSSTEVCS